MTITAFDIWLVGSLDGIRVMFWYGAIFFGAIGVVLLDTRRTNKAIITFILCTILGIGHFLIPSSKTAAAMMVLPTIVNSQEAQELPKDMVSAARVWLKDYIKEEIK